MATRARSRYNNCHVIQATLLPLFETYSTEPGFAKLESTLNSLRNFSKDLKLLQEQSVSKQENPVFYF